MTAIAELNAITHAELLDALLRDARSMNALQRRMMIDSKLNDIEEDDQCITRLRAELEERQTLRAQRVEEILAIAQIDGTPIEDDSRYRVREVQGRASTQYDEHSLRQAVVDHAPELLPALFEEVTSYKFNRKAVEAVEERLARAGITLANVRTVTPGVNRWVVEVRK